MKKGRGTRSPKIASVVVQDRYTGQHREAGQSDLNASEDAKKKVQVQTHCRATVYNIAY